MLDPCAAGVRGLILFAAAALFSAGCNDFYTCNTDGALPTPDPGSGICLPSNPNATSPVTGECYGRRLLIQSMPLQLGANDTVRVDARVVGAMLDYGPDSLFVVPEDTEQHVAPKLEWSASGGLDTTLLTGTTSALLVHPSAKTPLPASAAESLVATPEESSILRDGYVPDRLRVVDPGSTGTPAFVVVTAPFVQRNRSNIALVRAKGGALCEESRLLSFAAKGALTENLVNICNSVGGDVKTLDVTVWSESGAAGRRVFPQNDLPEVASFPPFPPSEPRLITVRVFVWLEPGIPSEDPALNKIEKWLAIADSVLLINRTGFRTDLDTATDVHELEDTLKLGKNSDLGAICDTLKESQGTRPADIDLTQGIHLFIANAVGTDNGLACPDSANGAIILSAGAGALTFVHELGHTLGLRPWGAPASADPGYPWTGHTHKYQDILRNNLMWPTPNESGAGHRNEFTLGQSFRMNFDERSWLNSTYSPKSPPPGPRETVLCQDSATVSWPCPRLDLDFADLLQHSVSQSSP